MTNVVEVNEAYELSADPTINLSFEILRLTRTSRELQAQGTLGYRALSLTKAFT